MITDFENQCLLHLIHKTLLIRGSQYPNPAVGAMVIKGNEILSEGFHLISGQPHAEVMAINNADQDLSESTILITMEPCCHVGKTPPCTDHIIQSGIRRVIWAIDDPNPQTSGKSKAILESQGIEVVDNACQELGQELIKEFFVFHKKKRPFIYIKAAVSLDGYIAPNAKELTYISSQESLDLVQQLRTNVQAICVGANTINVDLPRLSIRIEREVDFQPMIVILDPNNSVNLDWVNRALDQGRHIVVFSKNPIYLDHDLFVNKPILTTDKTINWQRIFSELYLMDCHAVLVEGGSHVFHSLLTSKYFDELWVTKTPSLLSSKDAIPFIQGEKMPELDVSVSQVEPLGVDVFIKYTNNYAFSI